MSNTPIADYALLSDCHSAALVNRRGGIDWLCFPRFDAHAVFARLLDEDAGHWTIAPSTDEPVDVSRAYLHGSLVLRSTFRTPSGTLTLTDALALPANERGHELGQDAPHTLVRLVECLEGEVDVRCTYVPRPEFGLITPLLVPVDAGLMSRGGAEVLGLSAPVEFDVEDGRAEARFRVQAGKQVAFALQHARSTGEEPRQWSQDEVADAVDHTLRAWRSWSSIHQGYDGPWEALVHHSGRVLQGLTYQPTGAIVAAATTSLPETVGGSRNWDYRYAWVRDASITLNALWVAACPDEAGAFFTWMVAAAGGDVRRQGLQIMYGVAGEHDLSERDLGHLRGWRGSRPVRVGNAAWSQRQLDVYGELLDAAHRLRDTLGPFDAPTREFLVTLADVAGEVWRERDHGIWEIRGEPQHYLYSKLMCWVALDRAIDLAETLEAREHVEDWRRTREEIREAILEQGWSDQLGAYAQAFGSHVPDASALMLAISGFLPAHDERMRATIERMAQELSDERGLVYRYRAPDGLAGREGAFLLCTYWLAECYALLGDVERARERFEAATRYVNDVGLLAEEVAEDGSLLGNFPQSFSHVGLVNAAWAISRAE